LVGELNGIKKIADESSEKKHTASPGEGGSFFLRSLDVGGSRKVVMRGALSERGGRELSRERGNFDH